MSEDMKKLLAGACVLAVVLFYGAKQWQIDKAYEEAKEREALAAYRALSPETKIRKSIKEITSYTEGETISGKAALNLTIRHKLFGVRSTEAELLHQASDHFQTVYRAAPKLETVEIQYDIQVSNAYGETSYSPALRIELARPTFERIQWQNFDPEKFPHVASITAL